MPVPEQLAPRVRGNVIQFIARNSRDCTRSRTVIFAVVVEVSIQKERGGDYLDHPKQLKPKVDATRLDNMLEHQPIHLGGTDCRQPFMFRTSLDGMRIAVERVKVLAPPA
jgi:hypothetical protein